MKIIIKYLRFRLCELIILEENLDMSSKNNKLTYDYNYLKSKGITDRRIIALYTLAASR